MAYSNIQDKRDYQRRWFKARRDAFFVGKSCVECGSIENLELDHKDRSQKVMDNFWSYSEERRKAELVKCQVMCHDCHLKKTIAENQKETCNRGHPMDRIVMCKGHKVARCSFCHNEAERDRKKRRREESHGSEAQVGVAPV